MENLSKHICFVARTFSRRDSLIVYRQGMSLVKSGYRVSYILCDGLPDEVRYGIEMKSIDTSHHGWLYTMISKNSHLKYRYERLINSFRFKQYLKQYDADVFQINNFDQLELGLYLKRLGKCVVYDLREYYPIFSSRKYKTKLVRRLSFILKERKLTKVANKFDAIFNCMPEMHDYIHKVMPCKFFEDVANFPVVDNNFSLTFEDYISRKKNICYFGTIYNISCQEVLLSALESFPEVIYTLAGVFYDKEYQKSLSAMRGWKQVDFINGFKREDLPDIINSSIIGNVVKDFDQTETPQGSYSIIKIFETMEAAVPVLLAKVPLYEQMVEKYHCGICVNPHSVEDFRAAIKYLIENPREAYEMGQNGRRAVIAEYSWDSQYKKYIGVIQELLKS